MTKWDWWELLGIKNAMTVQETHDMNIVDRDGVHLNDRANRCFSPPQAPADEWQLADEHWREEKEGKGANSTCLALCFDCYVEILVSSIPLVYNGSFASYTKTKSVESAV